MLYYISVQLTSVYAVLMEAELKVCQGRGHGPRITNARRRRLRKLHAWGVHLKRADKSIEFWSFLPDLA